MRRWLKRIAILLTVIVVLSAAAVQVVLWSDWPRQFIVTQLQDATGLAVEMTDLSTSWSGRTTVHGLRLTLPDDEAPLIDLQSATIRHTSVPALLTGRAIQLDTVKLEGLEVNARQDEVGRWNVGRAATMLESGQSTSGQSPLDGLASVEITDVTVNVSDRLGRKTRIRLDAEAESAGADTMKYTIRTEQQTLATGVFAWRDPTRASIELTLSDPHQYAGPWLADLPRPIDVHVRWYGQLGQRPEGRLVIDDFAIGPYRAAGVIDVAGRTEGLSFSPVDLQVTEDAKTSVVVDGGQFTVRSGKLTCNRVAISSHHGRMVVNGEYDLPGRTARIEAPWSIDRDGWQADGTMNARLEYSATGFTAKGTLTGDGRQGSATWTIDARLAAQGRNAQQFRWEVALPHGQLNPSDDEATAIPLSGLQASGSVKWPTVKLDSLRHRLGAGIEANGQFNARTFAWRAAFNATDLLLPGIDAGPFQVKAAAKGDDTHMSIDGVQVFADAYHLKVQSGRWRWGHADDGQPPLILAFSAGAERGDRPSDDDEDHDFSGRLALKGTARGSVAPLDVSWDAGLIADRAKYHRRPAPAIRTAVKGRITDDRITAQTGDFDLLGGTAQLSAIHRLTDHGLTVEAHMQRVDLAPLAAIIEPGRQITGTGTADLTASLPQLDVSQAELRGQYRVENLTVGSFAVAQLTGRVARRKPGIIELVDIRAEQGAGSADAGAVIDLRQSHTTGSIDIATEDWPIRLLDDSVSAELNGRGKIAFDGAVPSGISRIDFDVTAATEVDERPIGTLALTGNWADGTLTATMNESPLFDGKASGEITWKPQAWTESKGHLTWTGFNAEAFDTWLEPIGVTRGSFAGMIEWAPAEDPHAPEPFRIAIDVAPEDHLIWRKVPWGKMHGTVYLGPGRGVLQESEIELADGSLALWASLRRRPDGWRSHLTANFTQLDIDLLRQALPDQTDQPVPGRLAGRLISYGPIDHWANQTASAELKLTESSLINTDLIGSLLTNIGLKSHAAKGVGEAILRLDRQCLTIKRFSYHNGPGRLWLTGQIADVSLGMNSPISARAAGSFGDGTFTPDEFERLLKSLQLKVSTFDISGTLTDYNLAPGAIGNVKQWFNRSFK